MFICAKTGLIKVAIHVDFSQQMCLDICGNVNRTPDRWYHPTSYLRLVKFGQLAPTEGRQPFAQISQAKSVRLTQLSAQQGPEA